MKFIAKKEAGHNGGRDKIKKNTRTELSPHIKMF